MPKPPRSQVRNYHPAQIIVFGFGSVILAGSALLMLPISHTGSADIRPITALFTATSAVCVTGLATVETATSWTTFGHVVILVLIQLGGLGIMSLASLAGILISHRLGLRSRLRAQAETGALNLGDVRTVLRGVLAVTFFFEGLAATTLTLWFMFHHHYSPSKAIWNGVFHSISAYNNAGFALFEGNLVRFAHDPFVLIVIALAIIAGGIGFPVILDLRRERFRFKAWTLHTKLVVIMTVALILIGTTFFTISEWDNPATLGPLNSAESVTGGFFAAITDRTAGFNALDYGSANESTVLITTIFMFIGAAPAGTAGGVKVTTIAVLALMVWSEMRGDPDVSAFGRRLPRFSQRQSLAIFLLGLGATLVGTVVLITSGPFEIGAAAFEAASAFSTTGLTTGITPLLKIPAQLILIILMFLGRVGPVTLGTALVLRERGRLFRYPEERPMVG